jgi:hypothetical protein
LKQLQQPTGMIPKRAVKSTVLAEAPTKQMWFHHLLVVRTYKHNQHLHPFLSAMLVWPQHQNIAKLAAQKAPLKHWKIPQSNM